MMYALTLTQPWATLIAVGAKRIETRSWKTAWRDIIAIHAGAGLGPAGGVAALNTRCWSQPFRAALCPEGHDEHPSGWLPRGCIVAVATVLACVPTESARFVSGPGLDGWSHERTGLAWPLTDQERAFGDYAPGRYAWLLADVRRLREPVPCLGWQKLWRVPAEVEAAVRAQIGGGDG